MRVWGLSDESTENRDWFTPHGATVSHAPASHPLCFPVTSVQGPEASTVCVRVGEQ